MSSKFVRIYSAQWDRYVGADGESGALSANYAADDFTTQFELFENDDGTVSFRAVSNGKFVCVSHEDGCELVARTEDVEDSGRFRCESLPEGKCAFFMLADGDARTYVSITNKDTGHRAVANAPKLLEWEEMEIRDVSPTEPNRCHLRGIMVRVETAKDILDKECYKEIRDCGELLVRAYDSFDAKVFVLTCVGMLKSGKSTLIDLLSGCKDASPTGFGVDTTQRPSLIMLGDDDVGRIDVWKRNDLLSEDGWSSGQSDFERVILSELNGRLPAEKNRRELTDENLRNAVTDSSDVEEPILVVVRVPKNDESVLARANIVLLDTPGLDSGVSSWTKGEDGKFSYEWLLEATDMAVFLQSSVSALNAKAIEVLASLKEKKKETWLIHNEMRAKYWRTDDSVKPDEDRQKKQALDVFKKAGFDEKKEPLTVNLGKAYDATPGFISIGELNPGCNTDKLRNDSGIKEFEDVITKYIHENGVRIRRDHCNTMIQSRVKKLENAIQQAIDKLSERRARIISDMTEVRKEFERVVDHFARVCEHKVVNVPLDPPKIVDDLLREQFRDPGTKSKDEVEKGLKVVRGKLPEELVHRIKANVSQVEVKGMPLAEYIESSIVDFCREDLRDCVSEDRKPKWRDWVDQSRTPLLMAEKRRECVEHCVKMAVGKIGRECCVSVDISKAVEEVPWHKRRKLFGFGGMDAGLIVSAVSDSKAGMEEWVRDQCEAAACAIAGWIQCDSKDSLVSCLLSEMKTGLQRLVDKEVSELNDVARTLFERIEELGKVKSQVGTLLIKG